MPKKAERRFKAGARAQGLKRGSPRYNRYVYGGMQNRGLLRKQRSLGKLRRSAGSKRRSIADK